MIATLPLISVIMPVYNAEQYLPEAIDSVLKQDFTEWELIIINDGSTDSSLDIVQHYSDQRINVFTIAHSGNAKARNTGLIHAKGNYIAFLDADDCYKPNALKQLYTAIKNDPQKKALYGFFEVIDKAGNPLLNDYPLISFNNQGQPSLHPDTKHTWENILTCKTCHQLQGLIVERYFLAQAGNFNETLTSAVDLDLYLRLFLTDFDAIGVLPEIIFQFRQTPNSVSRSTHNIDEKLKNGLLLFSNFFESAPPELAYLQSKSLATWHRYLIILSLLDGQKEASNSIINQARENPDIHSKHWFYYIRPFICIRILPLSMIKWLHQTWVNVRRFEI